MSGKKSNTEEEKKQKKTLIHKNCFKMSKVSKKKLTCRLIKI